MRRAMESASIMSNSTWVPSLHDDQDLFSEVTDSERNGKFCGWKKNEGTELQARRVDQGDTISLAVAMASLWQRLPVIV